MEKLRRRPPPLDLKARIRFAADPESTMTVYKATVLEFTSRGAMVMVDLPCGVRLHLFEKVRHCILEMADAPTLPEYLLSRAVWLQPQTSAGDFMTFRIGLSFENLVPETSRQVADFAAMVNARNLATTPAPGPGFRGPSRHV